METITKFKAVDGKEFNDKEECVKYENLIERVNKIMAALPARPESEGCSFENGEGYLQHEKDKLKEVKIELLKVCGEYVDHKWIQQTIDSEDVHPSWVARLLSDYGIRPLQDAWWRFSCIDKQHREWGQPYFATNPEKGVQECVG